VDGDDGDWFCSRITLDSCENVFYVGLDHPRWDLTLKSLQIAEKMSDIHCIIFFLLHLWSDVSGSNFELKSHMSLQTESDVDLGALRCNLFYSSVWTWDVTSYVGLFCTYLQVLLCNFHDFMWKRARFADHDVFVHRCPWVWDITSQAWWRYVHALSLDRSDFQ